MSDQASQPQPAPPSLPPPLPSSVIPAAIPPPLAPVEDSGDSSAVVEYSTRNNAFTKPCRWVLDGPVLREECEGQPPRVWRLADVVRVNLQFQPTRVERNRYRCELLMRDGRTLTFFNRTYAGVYNFQETSAEYTAFVGALHRALALRSPGCQFSAGMSQTAYALYMVVAVFTGLILIGAGWFFFTVGFVAVALIKVLLILFYLPTLWKWFKRNKSASYDAHDIPASALPSG